MVQSPTVTPPHLEAARLAAIEQNVNRLDDGLSRLTDAVHSLVKNEAVADQRTAALSADIRALTRGFEVYSTEQKNAPKPFPVKEVVFAIGAMLGVMTTVVQVANWWQASALTAVNLRLGNTDLHTLEYRLSQLEKLQEKAP
jgi:hypothetical protein